MYTFNRIKVNPQLPKRIEKLSDIANNLWWSWNTNFLKIFKEIDIDLWERVEKNPVKFLKNVSQEKLEAVSEKQEFLKEYDKFVKDFEDYIKSKNTWFRKKYPENEGDLIAYFSAEYGLDEILPIYSGGLGILSGDHLKSASDLGVPLIAVGLLYKHGYFWQTINGQGYQETEYKDLDLENLPILPVKDVDGKDLIIAVDMPKKKLYIKVWEIKVGRVTLYLMDSDLEANIAEYREITKTLYGGNQETRIQQEIVLGMAGVELLRRIGVKPTVYHMNEGHSSFLIFKLIENTIKDKKVSFNIAKDIVSSKTVFTTHTPVPAGNDIFPIELMEKYFKNYWEKLGITKQDFFKMGARPTASSNSGFDMGVLALKVAGKKNGVSKLHGAVSRELFGDIWPNIAANESPITYVTNGIHTCSWLPQNIKDLYNEYLAPYWQDNIYNDEVWEKVNNIPNEKLWNEHMSRKRKLIALVKQNTTQRLHRCGYSYHEIEKITSRLSENVLTIGFARRFATYKRATLIFKDLERITQIFSNENRPIQIIFAGKAHPADKEGQDLIKYIHEISMKPQFKGKIFLLENYNIAMSRYLISGVDVWLNTPRRPMEASGTSGQKASVCGVINFSVLDGWWAEGYNSKNGWYIGLNEDYESYEVQDKADSEDIYTTLENKIIPTYYKRDENDIPNDWIKIMKNSIVSTGGRFSTSRMLVDYVSKLYIPLCNLYDNYYSELEKVTEYNSWKEQLYQNWDDIKITQENNLDNITVDAGNYIDVKCKVLLPNISVDNIETQVYYGKIEETGIVDDIQVIPMQLEERDDEHKIYSYTAKIKLVNGGEYGYTFRVMPKHRMLLDSENLDLVKWI